MLNWLPAAATGMKEGTCASCCSHRQSWGLHAYGTQFASRCSHRHERGHTCFPLQSQAILGAFAPTVLDLLPTAATGMKEGTRASRYSYRQSWCLRACGAQFASRCSHRHERGHTYFSLQSQAILGPSRLRFSICFPLQPRFPLQSQAILRPSHLRFSRTHPPTGKRYHAPNFLHTYDCTGVDNRVAVGWATEP